MTILMSHYNRSKKQLVFSSVFTILTHFSVEIKINIPFDLQNPILALFKPDLKKLSSRNISALITYY